MTIYFEVLRCRFLILLLIGVVRVIKQRLKRKQLAAVSLDGERSAAMFQSITLFAEEIEAASAEIRLCDNNAKVLGIEVTPQKLLLVAGYFASGLITLVVRSHSASA